MQNSLGNLKLELVSSPGAEESEEAKEAALFKALSLADFLPGARKKNRGGKDGGSIPKSSQEEKEGSKDVAKNPDEETTSVSSLSSRSLVYGPPSDASLLSQKSQQQKQESRPPSANLTFRAAAGVAREHVVQGERFPYAQVCDGTAGHFINA